MLPEDPRVPILVLAFVAAFVQAVVHFCAGQGRATLRARRVRRRLGSPVPLGSLRSLPRDTVVTVAGTLRFAEGEGEGVSSFHPYGVARMEEANVYARTRAVTQPAWLDTEGGRVALEPPFQVVVGAGEQASFDTFAPDGSSAPAPGKERVRGVRRHVGPGDQVIARGRLGFEASDADAGAGGGYREPARAYRLLAETDDAWPTRPIPLVAASGPRFKGRRAGLLLSLGWVAAGLVCAGLAVQVQKQIQHLSAAHEAAARPGPPACAATMEQALHEGRPDTALALSCDHPRATAVAHWMLGEVELASDAWAAARRLDPDLEPSASEAQAHSFAGRPLAARSVVRQMRDRWYRGPGSPEKLSLACLADAFGRRGGDAEDTRELDTMVLKGGPECQAVLGDFGYGTAPDRVRGLFRAERQGSGGGAWLYSPLGEVDTGESVHLRPVALEASILRPIDPPDGEPARPIGDQDDRLGYGHHAVAVAAFLASMGENARARNYLDLFDRIALGWPVPRHGVGPQNDLRERAWAQVFGLAARTAANVGDGARLARYLPQVEERLRQRIERHAELVQHRDAAPRRVADGDGADVEALFAATRDGQSLADALIAQKKLPPLWLLDELLSRALNQRDALRAWSAFRLPPPCATCGVFALAEGVGERRRIAYWVNDTETAARLGPVARRLVDIILRRDGAPEVVELERLSDRIDGERH